MVFLAALAACAAPGPPRGPTHKPSNSPQADTPCPSEREAAHSAREDWLENASDSSRAAVSKAVLAEASCHRSAYGAAVIPRADMNTVLGSIAEARNKFRDAVTLYREAIGYGVAEVRLVARVELAEMQLAHAARLQALPAPIDLDPQTARDFQTDLGELSMGFVTEAAMELAAALEGAGPEAPSDWVERACKSLLAADPILARGDKRCR